MVCRGENQVAEGETANAVPAVVVVRKRVGQPLGCGIAYVRSALGTTSWPTELFIEAGDTA